MKKISFSKRRAFLCIAEKFITIITAILTKRKKEPLALNPQSSSFFFTFLNHFLTRIDGARKSAKHLIIVCKPQPTNRSNGNKNAILTTLTLVCHLYIFKKHMKHVNFLMFAKLHVPDHENVAQK